MDEVEARVTGLEHKVEESDNTEKEFDYIFDYISIQKQNTWELWNFWKNKKTYFFNFFKQ